MRKKILSLIVIFGFILLLVFFGDLLPVGEYVVPAGTITNTEPPSNLVLGETVTSSVSECEVFITNPDGANAISRSPEEGVLELINNSHRSIDLAAFEFDLESMKQALAKAWYRGVEIRIVYDDEYTKKDLDMNELLSIGILGVPDNRQGLMHNKFMVVDRSIVWTGSFNFSENASHKNNENGMRIESSELAAIYEQEFEKMYSGNFGAKKFPDEYDQLLICGDSPAQVYFSPKGPKNAILKVLESAHNSIHVMAFSFTDDDMGSLLLSKDSQGLEVGAIFENRGSDTKYSEFGVFRNMFTDCTDANSNTFHHKVMIIDGHIVVLGSYNFTASAENDNDENVIIIDNLQIANLYEAEYQKQLSLSLSKNFCIVP